MTTPKRVAEYTAEGEPKPKRKRHGCLPDFLNFNKDRLLQEARAWMPTKTINWSKLAREYSIESPNGGQIIKEFLLQNKIPVAGHCQRPSRAPKRSKKKVSTISFPMYTPAKVERKKVHKLISNGEIQIGESVVPSQHNRCNVNPDTQVVQLDTVTTSARKIPLSLIRKNLLDKHEALGIIRNHSDEYFKDLSRHQILTRLTELGVSYNSSDDIQQKIKDVSRTRHIKVWHDHSSIANHGYRLVLVSVIYDPAFFYSREEMKKLKGVDIDVVAIAQKPQCIFLVGRALQLKTS